MTIYVLNEYRPDDDVPPLQWFFFDLERARIRFDERLIEEEIRTGVQPKLLVTSPDSTELHCATTAHLYFTVEEHQTEDEPKENAK